jgi:hypothetical protein
VAAGSLPDPPPHTPRMPRLHPSVAPPPPPPLPPRPVADDERAPAERSPERRDEEPRASSGPSGAGGGGAQETDRKIYIGNLHIDARERDLEVRRLSAGPHA